MAYTYYRTAALTGGWHEARIGLQVNSQSQVNNTSNITIRLEVHETVNASSFNLSTANLWISLDGVNKASKTSFDWRSLTSTWIVEPSMTWTGNVTHDPNGTLTISLDANITTGTGAGNYSVTAQSVALPTILRESLIVSPNVSALQDSVDVTITHYTGYDRLIVLIGSTVIKTIDGYTTGASFNFTNLELQAIYNASPVKTPTLTFQLKTYTTSAYTTQIGSTKSDTAVGTFAGMLYMKIGGVWKDVMPYMKIDGVWMQMYVYNNVRNIWERGI